MPRSRLPRDQTAYWDAAAATKVFAHPFDAAAFASRVPRGARVLDLGCGYGRTLAVLAACGYRAVGFDPSRAMLERARREHGALALVRGTPGVLPFRARAFDAATLFAVLTCVPDDAAQRGLVRELRRVLRPRGVLYVSDLLLGEDDRSRARYDGARPRGAAFGVFEHAEGVVLRHHDLAWIDALFADFDRLDRRELTVRTMNGHEARAFQLFGRR